MGRFQRIRRQRELDAVSQLLFAPQVSFVSIIGVGGVGKTCLAQQLANEMKTHFQEHVYFIPLGELSSARYILPKCSEVLGVDGYSEDAAILQLKYRLNGQRALLIFDNFEHVSEGALFLAKLVQQVPSLKILVTSRFSLNLQGETLYILNGMDAPPVMDANISSIHDWLRYDAIRLFVEVAHRFQPDREFSDTDFQTIAKICQLCGGVPLAILMAASWLESIDLPMIVAELEHGLDILTGHYIDLPESHGSFRVVQKKTWEMLSPEERENFAQLGLFRGTFTLEAARQVAQVTLPTLQALISKALIQLQAGYYSLHPLLRLYSLEKLSERPELEAQALNRFMQYYADWARSLEDAVKRREVIIDVLPEAENLQAAWELALQTPHPEYLGNLVLIWAYYYSVRGLMVNGLESLKQANRTLESMPPDPIRDWAWGRCLTFEMFWLGFLQQPHQAIECGRQALALFNGLPDCPPEHTTIAEMWMGNANRLAGNFEVAQQQLTQVYHKLVALGQLNAAWTTLALLGELSLTTQQLDLAEQLFVDCLLVMEQLGYPDQIYPLALLGALATEMGRLDEARDYMYQAVKLYKANQFSYIISRTLLAITNWLYRAGSLPEAAISAHVLQSFPMDEVARQRLESLRTSLREQLPTPIFTRTLSAAHQLRTEADLVRFVKKFLEPPLITPHDFTRRELDVLRLLVRGLSNQEIADLHHVSLGTIKQQTHQIFSKLGVRNRTQAVLRVHELNLIATSD